MPQSTVNTGDIERPDIELGWLGRFLSTPANITFTAIFVSIVLLQIPQAWYGRVWNVGSVRFGWAEVLLLAGIYLVLLVCWRFASSAARPGSGRKAAPVRADASTYAWLTLVTLAGALGVAAMGAVLVGRIGFTGILSAISGSQANELKEALYQDYQVGLPSLRYVNIVSAPAALFVFWRLRVRTPRTILLLAVSLACLLINSAVSHRLSIVAATVVYLILHFRSGGRLSPKASLAAIVAGVTVLVGLNLSRNSSFYSQLGIDNPFMSALSDAITYVASPAQGALAAMAILWSGDFRHATGISSELTTNSGLLEVLTTYGYAGLFLMLVTTTAFSYIYARLYFSARLEYVVGAGVIGYAFAEFWRVYFFHYGIFVVLLVFSAIAGWAVRIAWNSVRRTGGPETAMPQRVPAPQRQAEPSNPS